MAQTQICVDASVALKLVLDEEDSDKAHALWTLWVIEEIDVIAPCHLAFEVTSNSSKVIPYFWTRSRSWRRYSLRRRRYSASSRGCF